MILVLSFFFSVQANAQTTSDSIFLANSREVIFKVNSTQISPAYRQYLIHTVVPELKALGANGIVVGRSAASPEGPYENNRRLAKGRQATIIRILQAEGINTDAIRFDNIIEEYELLVEMMRQKHDPDYEFVKSVVDSCAHDDRTTKSLLMKAQGGTLFNRLKREYFPDLRAVRIMVCTVPNKDFVHIDNLLTDTIVKGEINYNPPDSTTQEDSIPQTDRELRRELLSIKTNAAMYAAYVPKYGWCPLPNVSVEYYPRHGHFTWQGNFDCPWWIGNTTNHKYFELRNYTLESRYYFRNSNKSYLDGKPIPNGKAAFKGLYASLYAHAFLYQIGCNKYDGWIGEGAGFGVGLGYVFPLSKRNQHWRIEIGAQFGFFRTKYDPFVYGCPVENVEDGLYYYDYTGDADLFKKRQYRFNWLGPTRAGITITYDLLYRRNHKKGASLKSKEKGGGR